MTSGDGQAPLNWDCPLSAVNHPLVKKTLDKLTQAGIIRLEDLLWILPLEVSNAPELSSFSSAKDGERFKGRGTILSRQVKANPWVKGKRGVLLFTVTAHVRDHFSDQVLCLKWFNAYPSLKKKIELVQDIIFSGQIALFQGQKQISNPEFFDSSLSQQEDDCVADKKYFIRYPTVNGITGQQILQLFNLIPDTLWDKPLLVNDSGHFPLHRAFAIIHGIKDWSEEATRQAKDRLIYYEFYQEQLKILLRRVLGKSPRADIYTLDDVTYDRLSAVFPFALTVDQQNALSVIRSDLSSGKPMMRLIQGDVGCGKTAVAFIAALMVITQNGQVAMMCPTEALAMQHYQEAEILFSKEKRRTALLLGSSSRRERLEIQADLLAGKIDIIFGTHSLIQETVQFKNLALAIIDEQHKFGVRQRIKLTEKGNATHSLIMTATPIPRSLSLTQFGDLDITTIKTMPSGRKGQKTRIVTPQTFEQFLSFLKTRLDMGEQAYVVVPAIEENEKQDLLALEIVHQKFMKFFPSLAIGTMHGRMSGEEKEMALYRFRQAEDKILIATSVIEVGINNPNATVMAIMNPDRFGLSSLHQLRGRVGRGDKVGFCFLVNDRQVSADSMHRLMIIEKYTDGFIIAEEDLKIRGEGDLFGTGQSGTANRRIANIIEHSCILQQVRADIQKQWDDGNPQLKQQLAQMSQDPLVLSTI